MEYKCSSTGKFQKSHRNGYSNVNFLKAEIFVWLAWRFSMNFCSGSPGSISSATLAWCGLSVFLIVSPRTIPFICTVGVIRADILETILGTQRVFVSVKLMAEAINKITCSANLMMMIKWKVSKLLPSLHYSTSNWRPFLCLGSSEWYA